MSFSERIDQLSQSPSVWVAAFGFIAGGIWWLLRNIFTNRAEIKALKTDLQAMKSTQDNIHSDVREIRQVLLKKD